MNTHNNDVNSISLPNNLPRSCSSIDAPTNRIGDDKNSVIPHQNKPSSIKDLTGKRLEYSSIDLKNGKTNKLPTIND